MACLFLKTVGVCLVAKTVFDRYEKNENFKLEVVQFDTHPIVNMLHNISSSLCRQQYIIFDF